MAAWMTCSSSRGRPSKQARTSCTSVEDTPPPIIVHMSTPVAGPFAIGERVGSSVWLADDTRNGKRVAVKLLTRQLPKDAAKRDALIRDVRVAAALYHTFLVPILEIVPEGDNLLMIMEPVEGEPISRKVVG